MERDAIRKMVWASTRISTGGPAAVAWCKQSIPIEAVHPLTEHLALVYGLLDVLVEFIYGLEGFPGGKRRGQLAVEAGNSGAVSWPDHVRASSRGGVGDFFIQTVESVDLEFARKVPYSFLCDKYPPK